MTQKTEYWTKNSDVAGEELNEFFEENDIKKPFRPWKTDRWKKRREELVADECSHCGATEDLQIHHVEHGPQWRSMWYDCREDLFFTEYYESERYSPHTCVCPNCQNMTYRGRVTKSPAYVCEKCKTEFSEPMLYPRTDAAKEGLWDDIWFFAKEHASEITELFEERFWSEWEAYFEGDDTITVCRSCHHKIES